MSKTKLKPTWYAMYRGDTFVDLGTADYLAEKYHKKKQSTVLVKTCLSQKSTEKQPKINTLQDGGLGNESN